MGARQQAGPQRVVDEITAFGGIASPNHDGVSTPEGGQSIVQAALDAFGRVDVLVNNAGFLRDKAFHKMDDTMIDAVVDVHLKGALYVSQPAFRLMREQGYGRLINGIKVNAIAPIASTRMTENILGDLTARVSPGSVSPLVAYLAHEECSVNGHVYSVAGGRIARIFVGETRGVVLPDNTPEAIRANLSLIDQLDLEELHQPSSLEDEMTIIAKAVAQAS